MNRRTFLKSAAASAVLSALPILPARATVIRTLDSGSQMQAYMHALDIEAAVIYGVRYHGTVTGRFSSSMHNFENIPRTLS